MRCAREVLRRFENATGSRKPPSRRGQRLQMLLKTFVTFLKKRIHGAKDSWLIEHAVACSTADSPIARHRQIKSKKVGKEALKTIRRIQPCLEEVTAIACPSLEVIRKPSPSRPSSTGRERQTLRQSRQSHPEGAPSLSSASGRCRRPEEEQHHQSSSAHHRSVGGSISTHSGVLSIIREEAGEDGESRFAVRWRVR